MSAVIDEVSPPPDVQERFGVACNTKNMRVDEHHRPADKIAAMGMVSLRMGMDAAGQHARLEKIEAVLAPLLWRIKAGGERVFEPDVAALFCEWMVVKGKVTADDATGVGLFARRLVHEWLHHRCSGCRGCGKQEKFGDRWQAPRGLKMLNPRFRLCSVCGGSGRPRPRHHERANALVMTMAQYEAGGWERQFLSGLGWLDRIARRMYKPLRDKTSGSSIRAC